MGGNLVTTLSSALKPHAARQVLIGGLHGRLKQEHSLYIFKNVLHKDTTSTTLQTQTSVLYFSFDLN